MIFYLVNQNNKTIKTNIKYISLKNLNRYITCIYHKLKKYNPKYYYELAGLTIYKVIDLLQKNKKKNILLKAYSREIVSGVGI